MEHGGGKARWDEAISGWRSDFVAAPEQLHRQRSGLLGLVGRRLREGWVGWDPVRDRWQPVLPVVLVFDNGVQLELAWQGWDELSVTWNTIDLLTPATLVDRPHEWRPSQPPALAAVAGRVLTGWAATEDPYFPGEADLTGELPMDEVQGWITQGLLMRFAGTDLHIYSGADTTFISAGYAAPARVAHQQLHEA
ncbi:hypothetical protein [Actinoplanes sp. L3-i22]|uniref:hypothetical protein n=1 Tax=Actinoplanes sp. L3-i22 TaxID=2836373 RepID=UPI001C7653E8|nr:hypothetical protein [Actinoplanes sp. L3-i22]BCY08691.1 hypothetical protein L3i22_037790 [Actinoplanes sp. L3-i22]